MSQDVSYSALLPMRPTNTMHQLGSGSSVPLLNGRQILDGLSDSGWLLWAPVVSHPAQARAILRAAAHQKAVAGLCMSPGSTDPVVLRRDHSPGAFFHFVREAAEEIDRVCPFVLHVEEAPVEQPRGEEFDAIREHLSRCLEAGFTSFGVDLSRCNREDVPGAAVSLLEQALDLELCLTVRLDGGSHSATVSHRSEEIAATVAGMKAEGVQPDLVLLPGPDEAGEDAWSLSTALAPLIAPSGIGWGASRHHTELPVEYLRDAFVRALVGMEPLIEFDASRDAERVEALAYLEATETLSRMEGKDSGPRLVDALDVP
jgi:hypothetical protein